MGLIKRLGIVAIILMGFVVYNKGYSNGVLHTKEVYLENERNYYRNLAELKAENQRKIDEISRRYNEEISEIKIHSNRTISNLNSANKRLLVKLRTYENSGSHRPVPAGKAELDPEFAKRIIGVTERGDAWIKALQDTIIQLNNKE